MEIIKYKKQKNNQYKVTFDNNTEMTLYEDVILKNSLLLKKGITSLDIKKYQDENKVYTCYYLLLKKVNTKFLTEKESFKILKSKDYETVVIIKAIDLLKKIKVIDDERYAKMFIDQKIYDGKMGPRGTMSELIKKGVNKEFIDIYIDKYSEEVEIEHIKKIISRYIKTSHNSLKMFKYKVKQILVKKGFTINLINSEFMNIELNETSSLKKVAILMLKRLSKKYEEDKLWLQLKNNLYKKGYQLDNIKEVINDFKKDQ